VTQPAARAARGLDRVERDAHGAIADGVDGHRDAGLRRALHVYAQLRAVDGEYAAIIRALVRLFERRGLRPERAVGEDLEVRKLQPLVAESGFDAELEGRVESTMRDTHMHA